MGNLAENMKALREEIERQRMEAKVAQEQHDIKRAAHIIYALIPMIERKLRYLARVH